MTQFEGSARGPVFSERDTTFFRRAILIPLGAIVLIGSIAVVGLIVSRTGSAPRVEAGSQAGEATDGWMAGVTAANRAARLDEASQVQDGWSAYLLRDEPEATDGWASYLLVDEPEIVDGWATRYLVDDDE